MITATELREGLLLVDKPRGKTSFSLIRSLIKLTGIKKIGHVGTLDPFATGVMIMLIGRKYTRLSERLLFQEKEYIANVNLGTTTDSYDCDGKIVGQSKKIPTLQEVISAVDQFQGEIAQIPPMFSAKKINGRKLYEYARKGETIERKPCLVTVSSCLLKYSYPEIHLKITCSKGTYIRSIAHEIGLYLGCGAHLKDLQRSRIGNFCIDDCVDGSLLCLPLFDISSHLKLLSDGDLSQISI